ncbi:hypothetical protein AU476_06680 [Cupriavidus sp. UYMSc13B]|nr:hypothetical protein AU476_06680 [Cupriavidus sp. UYMSc13B]
MRGTSHAGAASHRLDQQDVRRDPRAGEFQSSSEIGATRRSVVTEGKTLETYPAGQLGRRAEFGSN